MRYQSHAHPNDSRQTTLQAETPGDAAPENAAPGDAALLGAASSAGPARTSVQLWAVWFTLLVSVSGGALELLGGGVTAVGWALGLVALSVIAGWTGLTISGAVLSAGLLRAARRVSSIGRAHRSERQASETEAQRRQGARLLHDTVLATLTLLAHSGRGVSEDALQATRVQPGVFKMYADADAVPSRHCDQYTKLELVNELGGRARLSEDLAPGSLCRLAVFPNEREFRLTQSGTSCGSKIYKGSRRKAGKTYRITVTDHGDGIGAHHIPRLTERFYRVDDHRSRAIGGTGLGLAIVKHIVNRHRGRLRIESAPGEGSSFIIILPAE